MELMEKRGLDSCLSFLDRKIQPCPRNFSAKLFSLAGQCAATRAKLRPTMDEVRYRKSKLGKLYILSELLISETNSPPPENYSLIDKLSNLK